jgi:GNAT superfamily N-acetyltransferase
VADFAPAVEFLRRDVLRNNGLLQSLERNIPPVPRQVWLARRDEEGVVGVMMREEFPRGARVSLDASSTEALCALVQCLSSGEEHVFAIRDELWESLAAATSEVTVNSEAIFLSLASDDVRVLPAGGQVRRLGSADAALAARFPAPPEASDEPPLARLVEWAEGDPEHQAVFGLIAGDDVLSFVQFGWMIENLWEVGMIRTRPEHKQRGHAKAVLAHASRALLERGILPCYNVRADNFASLRTAQAVGYREVFRVLACSARVR